MTIPPVTKSAQSFSCHSVDKTSFTESHEETREAKAALPSFWRECQGPRAVLFQLLYENNLINCTGELIKNYSLPALSREQLKLLLDKLDQPFHVTVREKVKCISFTDLLKSFQEKLPEGYRVTDAHFFGSYLPHFLLTKAPGYLEKLFQSLPEKALPLIKEIPLSAPSDLDVCVMIEAPDGLTEREIKKNIRDVFLAPLDSPEEISFQKLKTVETGFNKFQLIQFAGSEIEITLCVIKQRKYLFSRDSYFLSLFSGLLQSYESCKLQGFIDILIGNIRTERPDDLWEGYLRLISRMTKGDLPIQRGLTKSLAARMRFEREIIESCLKSHHSSDPLESFVFLWNFTHFLHLKKEDICQLWRGFYTSHEEPEEKWAAQVIEMVIKEAVCFEELLATLHTALFLCAATENEKAMRVDLGCFELDRPVLMARVGRSTLHILYDPAKEMVWNGEHIALLETIFPCNSSFTIKEMPLSAMGGSSKIGPFSSLFVKDPYVGLDALVKGARDLPITANLSASIALALISKCQGKTTKTISQGLVYLVKNARSRRVASLLMERACTSGLIAEASPERTIGRLHLLPEDLSLEARLSECKKLWEEGEVQPSKQVDGMFTPLLLELAKTHSYGEMQKYLFMVPLTPKGQEDVHAGIVRQYLEKNRPEEAVKALTTLLETKKPETNHQPLINLFMESFLALRKKSWNDFCLAERLLSQFSSCLCTNLLLAKYYCTSLQLPQERRWNLSYTYFPSLLTSSEELPQAFMTDFIPVIIREIDLLGSPYFSHKKLLEQFIERAVVQLHKQDKHQACFSLFDVSETSKFSMSWSAEIFRTWQSSVETALSLPSANLKRVRAVMLFPPHSKKNSADSERLWVALGRKWICTGDEEGVISCVNRVTLPESVPFLWEAHDLLIKKQNGKCIIELLEKIFQLNPEDIDKIWPQYSHCLQTLCDLSTQSALLQASPVVQRANGEVMPLVIECGKRLLNSKKQKERMRAYEMLHAFRARLKQTEPEFWMQLLTCLQRDAPEKVWDMLQIIDPLLACDGKSRREAWIIGLKCGKGEAQLKWFMQAETFHASDTLFWDQVVNVVLKAIRKKRECSKGALTKLDAIAAPSLSHRVSLALAMVGHPDLRALGNQRIKDLLEGTDPEKSFDIICENLKIVEGIGVHADTADTIVSYIIDLILFWVKDKSKNYNSFTLEKMRKFFASLDKLRADKKIDPKVGRAHFSKWIETFVKKSCSIPHEFPHFMEQIDTVGNCLLKFSQEYSEDKQLLLELLELYTRSRLLAPNTQFTLVIALLSSTKLFHEIPLKRGMLFLFNYYQNNTDLIESSKIPSEISAAYFVDLITLFLKAEQFDNASQILLNNDDVLTDLSCRERNDDFYLAPFRTFIESSKTSPKFIDFFKKWARFIRELVTVKSAANQLSKEEWRLKQRAFSLFNEPLEGKDKEILKKEAPVSILVRQDYDNLVSKK